MPEILRRDVLLGLGAAAGLAACGGSGSSRGDRKIGIAVVGIGGVSTRDVLPAIKKCAFTRLTGLVSSSTSKLRTTGERFDVPVSGQYTYDDFDRIADNSNIDLVYIALPNALHADYTIRAARAGKHVLCEKPMAVSVDECEAMIEACEKARKFLAIAYRLHYSPHHQEMIRSLRDQKFGRAQIIRANIGYPLKGTNSWHLKHALAGGGVLLEQGVYPVNTARLMVGQDPVEVLGYEIKSDPRFAEVDETVCWSMRFANDTVAHCAASYTVPANHVWAGSSSGWFELDGAFSVGDISAQRSDGSVRIGQVDQFALQLDHVSRLILADQPPGAGISAEDGLRDVRIIAAIYESIRNRKVVELRT